MVAPLDPQKKPPPVFSDPFVILHSTVGGWPTQWYQWRVVLSDEYNQNDPDHPEWDVTQDQLKRLSDLGAARAATAQESSDAQKAKDDATAAGETWKGYYLPTPDPE